MESKPKTVELNKRPTSINLPLGLIEEIDALLRKKSGVDYRPPRSLSSFVQDILLDYYRMLALSLGEPVAEFVDGRGKVVKHLAQNRLIEEKAQHIAGLLDKP